MVPFFLSFSSAGGFAIGLHFRVNSLSCRRYLKMFLRQAEVQVKMNINLTRKNKKETNLAALRLPWHVALLLFAGLPVKCRLNAIIECQNGRMLYKNAIISYKKNPLKLPVMPFVLAPTTSAFLIIFIRFFRKDRLQSRCEQLLLTLQKQPSQGVLLKKFPVNMCSSANLLHVLRTFFHRNASGGLLLVLGYIGLHLT